MAEKRILTWDSSGHRWKKMYRGRMFFSTRGVQKNDKTAYLVAVEQFKDWRKEADQQSDADKSNASQYCEAIQLRQSMLEWLNKERDRQQEYDEQAESSRQAHGNAGFLTWQAEYDLLTKELKRLNVDFARVHPPPLDTPGRLPVNPLTYRGYGEQMVWYERLDILKKHEVWNGPIEQEKLVSANIDKFLEEKKQAAQAGQLSYGWWDVLHYHLDHFRAVCGASSVDDVHEALKSYYAKLLDEIKAKKITARYARGRLTSVKSFINWLYDSEVIDHLPRGLRKLQITADQPVIEVFSPDEIRVLLEKANERTRLYILLMLNCGMTPVDISNLDPREVDWKTGRIIRKRSKTKREKNVPVVNYKLWPSTFDLLKQFGHRDGKHVLLNASGQPLRRWEEKDGGGTRNSNAILRAWQHLTEATDIRKPLKRLRKTGASKLAEHEIYGRFDWLYLGHSPKTTAEIHYSKSPQNLIDQAIEWLGQQFGVK